MRLFEDVYCKIFLVFFSSILSFNFLNLAAEFRDL